MRDRETVQEKLEAEIRCEQQAQQMRKEIYDKHFQTLEQKLKKIKDRCNETLELMNKARSTNAYAGGRCIEAENILQIIDEVE